jgi:hypothetical protein
VDVPIAIGTTANETVIFVYEVLDFPLSQLLYEAAVGVLVDFNSVADIMRLYPVPPTPPADFRVFASTVLTDALFLCPTRNATEALLAAQPYRRSPIYHYQYNHLLSWGTAAWSANFTECDNEVVRVREGGQHARVCVCAVRGFLPPFFLFSLPFLCSLAARPLFSPPGALTHSHARHPDTAVPRLGPARLLHAPGHWPARRLWQLHCRRAGHGGAVVQVLEQLCRHGRHGAAARRARLARLHGRQQGHHGDQDRGRRRLPHHQRPQGRHVRLVGQLRLQDLLERGRVARAPLCGGRGGGGRGLSGKCS